MRTQAATRYRARSAARGRLAGHPRRREVNPHVRGGEPFPYRFRTNLSVKVLDFVQLGGPNGIRTHDLRNASAALFRLSYRPSAAPTGAAHLSLSWGRGRLRRTRRKSVRGLSVVISPALPTSFLGLPAIRRVFPAPESYPSPGGEGQGEGSSGRGRSPTTGRCATNPNRLARLLPLP